MTNKKLTQEEVTQIKEIQDRMTAVQTEFGQLELAKLDLEQRRKNVVSYLDETRQKEADLVKVLEDKYGKGTINLDTEEFVSESE
jgi:prefoldin subunit 5